VTNRPWHQTNREAFANLQERVGWDYPNLHFHERDGHLILTGTFPIADGDRVLDRYQVEVAIPDSGPSTDTPLVREIGGRIPSDDADHHMTKGTACLFVPEDFWYRHPDGMDLLAFLNGPMRAFFIGQSLVERGEPWPWGTRPHGNEGIGDFYGEFLGTTDLARVKACVKLLVANKLRGHKSCPCGSGRKVRDCHLFTLQQLRTRIPRRMFLESLRRLRRRKEKQNDKAL
jgi:hypothetical protein